MNVVSSPIRFATAVIASLALASVGREARAADGAEACIAEHANGQEQRKNGGLLAARASFVSCAAAACPDLIRSDCAAFAREVDAALPSVVLAVPASVDARSVSARVDSARHPSPLDGAPVPLDPGSHQVVFVLADGRTDTQTLTLREGEKSRRVEARFLPVGAPAASPTSPSRSGAERADAFRVPVVSAVFGGAALLATGAFAYFALQGHSDESELDRCAPRCAPSEWSDERDSMRANYLVADISLGVALASLGLGAYFLIDAQSNAPSSAESDVSFSVSGDVERGAFRLGASGRF